MEYSLEGQEVSRLCLDYAVVIETADATELRLETRFQITARGSTSFEVDPDRLAEAGSTVVGLLRERIATALIDESGTLSLQFSNGHRLRCEPDEQFEAWTLTTAAGERMVCLPGGGGRALAGGLFAVTRLAVLLRWLVRCIAAVCGVVVLAAPAASAAASPTFSNGTTTASAATFGHDVPAIARVDVREFNAAGACPAQLSGSRQASVLPPQQARRASTAPHLRFVATKWVDDAGNIRWPSNRGFAGTPVDDVLEVGTRVDRYGRPSGGFVSPQGTPYAARSLAPGTDPASLRAYEVIKPIEGVKTGQAAPWFDEVGGGIQHELPNSVQWLLDNGYLREVP